MASVNKVILVGNLDRDPEIRYAPSGDAICNVSIAKRVRDDDRRSDHQGGSLVAWLREMRDGSRPYDADAVRRRVLELAGD